MTLYRLFASLMIFGIQLEVLNGGKALPSSVAEWLT